jgi:hypothetical protein
MCINMSQDTLQINTWQVSTTKSKVTANPVIVLNVLRVRNLHKYESTHITAEHMASSCQKATFTANTVIGFCPIS